MKKRRLRLAVVDRYRIVTTLVAVSLAPSGAFAATSSIILYDSGVQSETVVAGCDLPLHCERPRINDHGEIVWTERLDVEAGLYGIFSSDRGLITSGYVTRDPDINNSGEVIWRFGDGSNFTPNGIGSSVRGLVLLSTSIDPYYDTQRINNNGEIIAGRESGGFARVWSTVRGDIAVASDIVRETEVNDSGEVVFLGRTGIFSTVRGAIQAGRVLNPDINNLGEIVWQQSVTMEGGPQWEIWSNLRGKLGDGESPSINDAGEVVWSSLDGQDYEIYSSVRGQISSNDIGDVWPHVNNSGDIVWLREETNFVPEPSALAIAALGLFLGFGGTRYRARLACQCVTARLDSLA